MKKETNKDKTTMTAREVAVLVEDFRSQFRIFGEDLSTVKQRVETIFEEQGRIKEAIFIIKADINVIKSDIKEIKARLDRIEGDVKVIKEDLKVSDRRISRLEETAAK